MTLTRAPAPRPSIASQTLKAFILAYQAMSRGRSPACRFVPSCSDFALEAIGRYGATKGTRLVVKRLVRCRPGGPFGFDPVPDGRLNGEALESHGPEDCSPEAPIGEGFPVGGAPGGDRAQLRRAPTSPGAEKRTA